jgi:hypothetical protein
MIARQALQNFLIKKRYEEQLKRESVDKKRKRVCMDPKPVEPKEETSNQETTKKEVDDILNDHEKLANIQKMLSETEKSQSFQLAAQNNKKILQMQCIIDNIFELHHQGQIRHEALKRTMHYKYP